MPSRVAADPLTGHHGHLRTRPLLHAAAALAAIVALGIALHPVAGLAGSDDLALVRDAAGGRSPALTTLAHAVSLLGRSVVLVPAAIAVIVVAGATPRRMRTGLSVLAAILGAIVIQNAVKAIVARPRPPVTHLEHVTGTSFPSGHATESAAFWIAVALLAGRRRRVAIALAALVVCAVSVSRVYLGVHYPTDVVAGVLLGGAWAGVVSYLSRSPRSDSGP